MNKRLLVLLLCCSFFSLSCSTEGEDWAIAKSENTIAAHESFLELHPDGKYADSAKAKIEGSIWQRTLTDNSVDGYEAYLLRYANGEHADSANWFLAALDASRDTTTVVLYREHVVIPYGRSKLLTIFNPRVLNGNRIELSYKLENGMEGEPVLIASFTEANIAALTSSFYYFKSAYSGGGYDMSERTIEFLPRPADWVHGRTKVRIYLVMADDTDDDALRAVSNVVSLSLDF